jgi:PelA/Pel-15E family pectate lyase
MRHIQGTSLFRTFLGLLILAGASGLGRAATTDASALTRAETVAVMRQAVAFYRTKVAVHGAYGYRTSTDLLQREGEQAFTATQGWIESPGTAAVGLALLEAYQRTCEPFLLEAAVETGMALVNGQLVSGGWCEHIEFDPLKRKRFAYRADSPGAVTFTAKRAAQQPGSDGFLPHDRPLDNEMNGRESPPEGAPLNVTSFDDDKSQGSLRFLMLLDRELEFAHSRIHAAVQYAQEAFLAAQYPNGGWPQHFREIITPPQPASLKASYPETWSREHAWTGFSRYYTINDSTLRDLIRTMLLAHEIYGEQRFLDAAKRGGDFLILAQMPAPQPAWAQQYNFAMQPVWARVFEPPAVSGGESQAVMLMLIDLALATGEARYLEPVPRAVEYLRSSLLPDGRLARFYELRTNRPLFMTLKYQLTYDGSNVPTHYSFFSRSQLDAIAGSHAAAERQLAAGTVNRRAMERRERNPAGAATAREARAVIDALDTRGAWVEPGTIRISTGKEREARPVIESRTFIRNLHVLANYAATVK